MRSCEQNIMVAQKPIDMWNGWNIWQKVAIYIFWIDCNATQKYTTDISMCVETILFNWKEFRRWMSIYESCCRRGWSKSHCSEAVALFYILFLLIVVSSKGNCGSYIAVLLIPFCPGCLSGPWIRVGYPNSCIGAFVQNDEKSVREFLPYRHTFWL